MIKYSNKIKKEMRTIFNGLNEKEKRFYAGSEANKLGYGGQSYIARILKCCRQTVYRGLIELKLNFNISKNKVRKSGGGRKAYYVQYPKINSVFQKCIDKNTAGNPMKENQKWTNLNLKDIVECLEKKGTHVSDFVVRKLLKKHGYVKRSNQKKVVKISS